MKTRTQGDLGEKADDQVMITKADNRHVDNHWYLVSSHGAVLFYVAVNPDCTITQISDDMALTQRTVWGIIGDLRRAGMLNVRREGRRHHYTVNLDAPFKHPILRGLTIRLVMGRLVDLCARARSRQAAETANGAALVR
jgi:DNA-binding transcriptional ArsR family regulator